MAFIRSGGFRILLVVTACAALASGVIGITLYLSLIHDLPDLKSIEDYRPPLISRVLDRNGTVIAEFATERRRLAPLDTIPEHTRLAFVAAEDGGFFEHKGIDYRSIMRAAIANLKAGGAIKQGASTITQQTVKSLLLSPERTFRRKFREMILARKIEQHLSKDEILYLYLNQIYFGHGAWGIAEAAHTYFDKGVEELTVSESALLAGLPQRPNSWQPFANPEGAEKRWRYVLKRMLEEEIIDTDTYEEALASPPVPVPPSERENFEPSAYFAELVRRALFERFGGDRVLNDGLTIETTVDFPLQKTATESVRRGLQELDHRSGYRGPVRQVEEADLAAEIETLGIENELVPEPEEIDPVAEDAELLEGIAAATGEPGAQAVAADEEAVGDSETPDEGQQLADTEPAGDSDEADEEAAESIPLPVPFGEPLLGIVTAVDSDAQTAEITLAPDIQGEVTLEDVSWAREPDTTRSPRPVEKISKVFRIGDVAHFVRLEREGEDEAQTHKGEGGEDAEAIGPPPRLTLHQEPEAQGALLSLEHTTGDVLALVGGYDYGKSQFNRVTQALRQPGSAFKPIIYGAALAQGYTPVQTLYDRPVVYEDPVSGFKYKPQNYERRFFGPVPMRFALAHSINNATVHLFRDVGVDYVIETARRLGIESHLERDLSLAIGSSSVTLLELTSAYSVFPNGGRRLSPRFIVRVTDRDGQVLLEDLALGDPVENPKALVTREDGETLPEVSSAGDPESETLAVEEEALPEDTQIISEEVAYLMCDLLKAVVNEGTGRRLKDLGRPLAGKTGTTNDFVDAWFMGFSPEITTGVWVGHDQATTRLGWGESGARAALPIWKSFMAAALAERPVRDFEVPDKIVFERVDRATGLLADSKTQDAYFQPFLEGNVPTETSESVSQTTDTQRALRSDAF